MPISFGIDSSGPSFGISSNSGSRAKPQDLLDVQHRLQRQYMENAVQWRANDARKAGLHPLFAMGAQVQASAPGGGFSSATGGGSSVKASLGALVRKDRAAAEKDEAIAGYYRSLVARGAQNSNVVQDRQTGETLVYPSGATSQGVTDTPAGRFVPLSSRATRITPKQSHPLKVQSVGPYGRREVLNPELGLDEVSQVLYAADLLGELLSSHIKEQYDKWFKFHGGRGRIYRSK